MATYDDRHSQYISDVFAQPDAALAKVLTETRNHGLPAISVQPEEGRFLQFLVRACGARKALEIGTLGGYSGTWIARGLPPDGLLITLELSSRHAEVAAHHFSLTGVARQVKIRQGDAHQLLPRLAHEAPFDFVFIDAEKTGYREYYEWAVNHVRQGAIIAAHNAFRGGAVVAGQEDETSRAIRDLNAFIANDDRVLATIYPGGDGMVIAVRT